MTKNGSYYSPRKRLHGEDCGDVHDLQGEKKANICTLEDWAELKLLYKRAVECVERDDDIEHAIDLLRQVLHECNRFLSVYKDPSVLFVRNNTNGYAKSKTSPTRTTVEWLRGRSRSPTSLTPAVERMKRDWDDDDFYSTPSPPSPPPQPQPPKDDPPTAFHFIYGSTLFRFGHLLLHHLHPSPLSLKPGEPTTPSTYFLASIDVFEKAECIEGVGGGGYFGGGEDWEMAIMWGQTLVGLAMSKVEVEGEEQERSRSPTGLTVSSLSVGGESPFPSSSSSTTSSSPPIPSPFVLPRSLHDPPSFQSPSSSPFPNSSTPPIPPIHSPFILPRSLYDHPTPSRSSSSSSSAHDLLMQAQDHFMRGIFHMPHHPLPSSSFSRSKTLYTIANSVLHVAEKMKKIQRRRQWAEYADGVFGQLQAESHVGEEQVEGEKVKEGRGRCALVVGTSLVQEQEEEGKVVLERAIGYFESIHSPRGRERIKGYLAEALLSLGKAAKDSMTREELYKKAGIVIQGGGHGPNDENGEVEMDVS